MADRRQAVVAAWPPHALLALTMPHAGWLEVERTLLPSARALPFHFSSFAFTRVLQQSSRSAIAAVELRRRLAHAPLQKCVGQLVCSPAVISSTSSTSYPSRLSLGKGALATSAVTAMGVTSPELRPPWPG